jgi:hypothetical protein
LRIRAAAKFAATPALVFAEVWTTNGRTLAISRRLRVVWMASGLGRTQSTAVQFLQRRGAAAASNRTRSFLSEDALMMRSIRLRVFA